MPEIRIKKVRFTKDDKIVLDYDKPQEIGSEQYHVTYEVQAAPGFYDAMRALAIHVIELCELPESYVKRLTMRSVSYTYKGDEGIMGATMAAVMELYHSDSVLALNTPHKPSRPYDPNATEPYGDRALSEACVNALWELARQAELYINGERGQITLDFDQATPDEAMPETPEDGADEAFEDDGIEDMGNVVNFPTASNGDFHEQTVY